MIEFDQATGITLLLCYLSIIIAPSLIRTIEKRIYQYPYLYCFNRGDRGFGSWATQPMCHLVAEVDSEFMSQSSQFHEFL